MENYNKYILNFKNNKTKLLRKFDEMYKNCIDPYNQSNTDNIESEIILSLYYKYKKSKGTTNIIDIGSGLGYLTNKIQNKISRY